MTFLQQVGPLAQSPDGFDLSVYYKVMRTSPCLCLPRPSGRVAQSKDRYQRDGYRSVRGVLAGHYFHDRPLNVQRALLSSLDNMSRMTLQ